MMKGIRRLIVLFCVLVPSGIKSQNSLWESVSPQITGYVYAFYEDTLTDRLYIAGGTSNGFCSYDGTSVTPIGSGLCPGLMRVIIKYNDTLYLGGNCPGHHLMRWNGGNWDTTNVDANQNVSAMCVYNGELYVGGQFTTIGGISSNGLAKYDGTSWTDISGFPFSYNYGVHAICSYNNELYIGGSFGDSVGNVMNIARRNGNQWNSVGTGFYGGVSGVDALEVYNNKLYIGGMFTSTNGNAGDYVVEWNGAVLSDVGGGLMGMWNGNGQVYDLLTYDNELYACGAFSYAGGAFAQYVAKWNGTDWCGFGDTLNNLATALGSYHDSLYIGGAFTMIDSDAVFCFAMWRGGNYVDTCGNTTGILEQTNFFATVQAYPNPSSAITTFQFLDNSATREIIITDQLGKEIWRKESSDLTVEFPAHDFSMGMYFYRVEESSGVKATGKLVIE